MKARLWAAALTLLFGIVLVWYLVYTQQLKSAINADAAAVSRMYARIFRGLSDPAPETRLAVLFDMLEEIDRLDIPAVVIDPEGNLSASLNLPFEADLDDPLDRQRVLRYAGRLDERNDPIVDPVAGEIHFGVPAAVERLRWVPFIQAATLIVIVLAGVWIFRSTLRAEQERVWATMARESAHQLGTPLSSLSGWVEILRMSPAERSGVTDDGTIAREVEVDLERLNKVAQRFELIGKRPRMQTVDLSRVLWRLQRYFQVRLPRMDRSIDLIIHAEPELPPVSGNPVLLEWAFENIIKNAIDVLAGLGGRIEVRAEAVHAGEEVQVRIKDDGPGVPPDMRKHIFRPGASRKQGGWGVGLSLTRRIVEETHGGTIELGRPDVGSEFIVRLPAANHEASA